MFLKNENDFKPRFGKTDITRSSNIRKSNNLREEFTLPKIGFLFLRRKLLTIQAKITKKSPMNKILIMN
ncbi:MAG: hypothetical protein CML37_01300 [Rhodobacteraceae bacterium]|nr:hypothetical protein [Paracoccaceae bacterium]